MQIDHGRFNLSFVNMTGERFLATGFVSEDGTLALIGSEPSEFLAEAYIDPDTREVKGIYSIGQQEITLMGDLNGREAD